MQPETRPASPASPTTPTLRPVESIVGPVVRLVGYVEELISAYNSTPIFESLCRRNMRTSELTRSDSASSASGICELGVESHMVGVDIARMK